MTISIEHHKNGIELCNANYEACVCLLPKDHDDSVHVCSCDGMWEEKDDMMRVHQWPNAIDLGLPLPGPWEKK